ncbi:MAG TPA: transglycosylase domain-containing protein [Microbacteriaceae bacterium]
MSDSRKRPRLGAALGGLIGFVAISAVAAVLVVAGVTPAIAVASMAAGSTVSGFDSIPEYLKIGPLPQTTTFYATQGGKEVPIATFYAQNRVGVAWNAVSQYEKDAAVATEDPRFYSEGGIDLIGTIRAALSNAAGSTVQGGSSITQQYVKNVLVQVCDAMPVNADAAAAVLKKQQAAQNACYTEAAGTTIKRKVQEVRYAIGLDKQYSKDQILLSYLNIAGFGGSVYGIQAAAEYYFGVSAADLTLPQAATLTAILNNPNYLRIDGGSIKPSKSSLDNTAANGYAAAKDRRDYVLQRMLINHKITQTEYDAAVKTKIEPSIHPVDSGCMSAQTYDAGFFCNYVEGIMQTDPAFGKTAQDRTNLFNLGGMQVYTTLNLDLQNSAQAAINKYIPSTDPNLDLGSANVAMEVGTGRVVNMVENKTYNDTASAPPGSTSINYTTDYDQGGSSGFQTGSSFKAFDLAAWLEDGHTIYETVNAPSSGHTFSETQYNAPCVGGFGNIPWPVGNDEGEAGGNMSVLSATEASVNTAFAQMGTKTNLCDISNAAKGLLVHSASPGTNPWTIVPPMILGTNYISPLTMATAYAGIANNGVVCTPIAIDKVINADGTQHALPKTKCSQGIPANIAAGVEWTLQHVMTAGTATAANPNDGIPIFGKTGTTDNSEENWLVTSTMKVATATWVGNLSGHVALRSQYFGGYNGGDVKFHIAQPILAALNAHYGGGALATPSPSLLNAPYVYQPPVQNNGNGNGNGGGNTNPVTPVTPPKPKPSHP